MDTGALHFSQGTNSKLIVTWASSVSLVASSNFSERAMLELAEREENLVKHHQLNLSRLNKIENNKYCIKIDTYDSCQEDTIILIKRFVVCNGEKCVLEVGK